MIALALLEQPLVTIASGWLSFSSEQSQSIRIECVSTKRSSGVTL